MRRHRGSVQPEGGPAVSVVIVSDYEPGAKTWDHERVAIRAFLDGNPGIPFDIVVMASLPASGKSPGVPADIAALAPRVRVHFEPSHRSSMLKDAALQYCSGELVAVTEADCQPQPGWLAHLLAAMEREPSLDAVSGITTYGTSRAMLRVATLLDRGFIECRRKGRYLHIANNGALYRRKLLEQYPYPQEDNPFISAELRLARMRNGKVRHTVEPAAVMLHAYGGLRFLADVRRNKGFQAARHVVRSKLHPPSRSRLRTALLAVRQRFGDDLATVRIVGRRYLRWTDWPLLGLMLAAVRIPEFLGALLVDEPERFAASTAYR